MQIKVRGWHTVKKVMFSAEEMAADQLTLLPTGQFINVSGDHTYKSVIYSSEKFIPLLFSGLEDKKGQSIFAGDIVKDSKGVGQVTFMPPGFIVKDSDGNYWWLGAGLCYPDGSKLVDTEIIGNIFESPELMI